MRRLRILLAAAMLAMLIGAGCDAPGETAPAEDAELVDAEAQEISEEAQPDEDETVPETVSRRLNVLVYYASKSGEGLVGESHEIFMTPTPGDRAKQIIADLIAGPIGERGLRSIPAGTRLRQIYLLEDGTAYVDFSADIQQGLTGGSAKELVAVYSIVNSLALNIPEIRRVGILIDGKPIETLSGHIDLRRPLSPNTSWILGKRSAHVALAEPSRVG